MSDEEKFLKKFQSDLNLLRKSSHHVVPTSRGGEDNNGNKILLNSRLHSQYHALFSNRTPKEILKFLLQYFWGGDTTFIKEFILEEEANDQKMIEGYKKLSN